MATQQEIDSFYQYACQQLVTGNQSATIDELYDRWRLENRPADWVDEDIAAIQESIDDLNRGVVGRDMDEVIRQLRTERNLGASD